MPRILTALIVVLGLTAPLHAQSDSAAIENVIGSQLEAFGNDDFETAFSYASPNIKQIFRSPERFETMVKEGFPMVARPGEVEYLALSEQGGRMVQKVLITDRAGTLHTLAYQMIETENGWQINGVRILKEGQVGA